MKENMIIKMALTALIGMCSVPVMDYATNETETQGCILDYTDQNTYTFYDPAPRTYPGTQDNIPVYTSHDYQYEFKNYGRYYSHPSYQYVHPYKPYQDFDDFSAGISSYQGTSTGPGPNGGYPGTPRGTYRTYYNATAHPH